MVADIASDDIRVVWYAGAAPGRIFTLFADLVRRWALLRTKIGEANLRSVVKIRSQILSAVERIFTSKHRFESLQLMAFWISKVAAERNGNH